MLNINIPIYQAERTIEGLAEKIQAQSTIAYLCPLFPVSFPISDLSVAKTIAELVVASENDTDLYRTKSILVSSNWNKNDDVFDAKEVWAARNTPSHKPTNIGHDEHQLCGHITNTWAIDAEGKIIADNINPDELPSLFHIVNGAVIYKSWQDKNLIERTDKLIAEIEDGKKYVSMECLFTDFDYAVSEDDGKTFSVIARDEKSAFITKHLRAYGGDGKYENKRVGRLLKNITFCGKGYVDKPANPNSIIFAKELASALNWDFKESTEEEKNVSLENSSVYSNNSNNKQEEDIMNENELKDLNEKLQASEAKVVDTEKKVGELIEANEKLTAKVSELEAVVVQKDANIDELVKSKSELQEELNKVRANELKTNRVSKLVDGGIDKEVATQKVELFINLNDEQFNAVADELISVAQILKSKSEEPKVEDTEGKCAKDKEKGKEEAAKEDKEDKEDKEEDMESDAAGEQAAETDVSTIEPEVKPDLTAASNVSDQDVEDLRGELIKAISGIFGIKEKK